MEKYEFNTINDRYIFTHKETINEKYIIQKKIGLGSYSNVFLCMAKNNNINTYAVKILRNNRIMKYSGHNELNILKKLKHPNVMRIIDNFVYDSFFMIVMPYYSKNLYQFCKQQIYINHYDTCAILLKITHGLDYLKRNNVIHRDLKPENILINSLENVVIADFGMSIHKKTSKDIYGFHVQTMYYRAPEIFFTIDYDESIDIWSLGCIAYELYWKKPLFKKNDNLNLFIEQNLILGHPPLDLLKRCTHTHYLYDDINNPSYMRVNNQIYLLSGSNSKLKKNHNRNSELISFITECCSWKKEDRINPSQALKTLKNIQQIS
jgi:serine/threonine protein kinase